MDIEKVEEFYEFLQQTKLPEGTHCKIPKLSKKAAFNIIWFLQEITGVLPDSIEQCTRRGCGELFDTHAEGHCVSDDYKEFGFKKRDEGIRLCQGCYDKHNWTLPDD